MLNPRVLGGYAVIPTGSTLLQQIPDPEQRAELILACERAIIALRAGMNIARDDTAIQFRARNEWWPEIGARLRCKPSTLYQSVERRRATLARQRRRAAMARRAA